jgi:hypothetical protein
MASGVQAFIPRARSTSSPSSRFGLAKEVTLTVGGDAIFVPFVDADIAVAGLLRNLWVSTSSELVDGLVRKQVRAHKLASKHGRHEREDAHDGGCSFRRVVWIADHTPSAPVGSS